MWFPGKSLFQSHEESASANAMLAFFVSELDVRAKRIAPRTVGNADAEVIFKEVRAGLDKFSTTLSSTTACQEDVLWNEAYRLERLLALLEPPENLWPELRRRVAEAKSENITSSARLGAEADAAAPLVLDSSKTPPVLKPEGEMLLRTLLLDTLEELHYYYQKKFYSRPIQREATYKIVYFGLITFAFFIIPYVVFYAWLALSIGFDWKYWTWLPLYASLTAGLFGALFSRLLYLQSNWGIISIGGLKDARDVWSIFLRGCVGMTGAVIVSFFLQSGVIAGGLFPEFNKIGMEETQYPENDLGGKLHPLHIIYPSKALALLVVWSFLAGFSERLVPSILQETEIKIGKKP